MAADALSSSLLAELVKPRRSTVDEYAQEYDFSTAFDYQAATLMVAVSWQWTKLYITLHLMLKIP